MAHNQRRILELLTIPNWRKLYKYSIKNKKVKILKNLPKFIILLCFASLSLISCKDEKSTATSIENGDKVKTKLDDTTEKNNKKVILFYGNSLTAGYGLDPNESFPSNIEDIIDSLGLAYKVVNAGLSGETTSGGLKRLDWVMKQKVDIFILELGANDMLRGLPIDETRKNLSAIIEGVKAKNPNVKIGLCEMMAPPNMGDEYVEEFTDIYADLSKPDDIIFFPFFLEGVAGNPDLLLQDGKHPNAEGQKIVADNVWKVLKTML
jgi:acyl-CoA thioesterase-1